MDRVPGYGPDDRGSNPLRRTNMFFEIKYKIMAVIKINILECKECPFHHTERMYTSDPFEIAFNYFCDKKEGKKIQGYVEAFNKVYIPKWCPIKE